MAGIRRLNHAVLYVTDAKKSATFYCDVLGFSIVQDNAGGRAVFIRAGGSTNHHDLGLFSVGATGKSQGTGLITSPGKSTQSTNLQPSEPS